MLLRRAYTGTGAALPSPQWTFQARAAQASSRPWRKPQSYVGEQSLWLTFRPPELRARIVLIFWGVTFVVPADRPGGGHHDVELAALVALSIMLTPVGA